MKVLQSRKLHQLVLVCLQFFMEARRLTLFQICVRFVSFMKMASSASKILAEKLPSTEQAAIHHSSHVHLQVITVTFHSVLSYYIYIHFLFCFVLQRLDITFHCFCPIGFTVPSLHNHIVHKANRSFN